MRHQFVSCAAAIVAIAALGCSKGSNNTGGAGGSGVGLPAGGTNTAAPAGTGTGGTTTATQPNPSGGGGPMATLGTGGATSPAGSPASTGGTGGGVVAGTGGATGGTMGGSAGSGASTGGTSGMMTAAGSCGPATTNSPADLGDPMKLGPWMPTTMASTGPSGQSTLFYPTELGKGGVLHPVFHWGCGAGSTPQQYADHLNLLASHGFVVIANASGSMPAKPSLDWILAENDKMGSMFYQKLDKTRVGIGGHSLGALETFQAADDPRITLYVLVCGGSGSGTTGAANIHAPSIFLGGEGEAGTMNFAQDYAAIPKAPSIFVTKTNTDHIYCARNNLGPWVAFMRMNWCGEDKWKAEFMPSGTYCKDPWLACMTKNF